MTSFAFLLLSLATWRVSSLLVCEDGPGDVFKRLRSAVCRSPFLSGLLSCVWCCSVWVGMGWAAAWRLAPGVVLLLAMGFSLSATSIIIQRWMEVMERKITK